MDNSDKFKWTAFYMALADSLLTFRHDRATLIERIQHAYDYSHMKLPTLEKGGMPKDIDPFTIYGLFNKGITDDKRKTIISAFKSVFSIAAEVPDDFSGIPVLMNMKAVFYAFEDTRSEHDIDNLWDVFAAAITLANSQSSIAREQFCQAYNKALKQARIKWNLTMGLFWIRPYNYLNLDSRNRWFLGNPENISANVAAEVSAMKDTVPTGEMYLEICDKCLKSLSNGNYSYNTFPGLSDNAWITSNEVNQQIKCEKNHAAFILREMKSPPENSLGDAEVATKHIWLFAPGKSAVMWDEFYTKGIMALGWSAAGDLRQYNSKEEIKAALQKNRNPNDSFMHPKRMLWQFAKDMKPGDIVFAKKGRSEIIGRGIVTSNYKFDSGIREYPNVRNVKWTHKGNWDSPELLAMQTLTDLTNYTETVSKISALFETEEDDNENDTDMEIVKYPIYTAEYFLNDVYLDENSYSTLVGLLRTKQNVILQGAPGVGKTFIAKRLAYSMMGVKDPSRVMMVQFHQSYSYEDFIMGIRPSSKGFEVKKGVFYNFCKKAEDDSENDYFFIIDEINRGNLSKIFGELFMLIENDKRGSKNKIQLLYSDEMFYIPSNIYIIGMMNTADRSLAMLDYALRRRFAFFNLTPAFSSEGFKAYQENLDNRHFDNLIACVKDLNQHIKEDESLGEGFCIGHSYFCNIEPEQLTDQKLSMLVEYEFIPMLTEYWFDEPTKVREWSDKLRSAIK